MHVIKSISYDQDEILDNILALHCAGPIEVDPTYSKGNFYRNRPRPEHCLDLHPQFDFVKQADCRNLPLEANSFKTVILDLPFGIGSGPSLLKKTNGQNITPGRFSCFRTSRELFSTHQAAIKEMARILSKNGVLIQKIQPVVACSVNWPTHFISIEAARENGLVFVDEFILLSKHRPISGKVKKQQHARKFHSYFYVFRKR